MSNLTLNSGETLTLADYAERLRDDYRTNVDTANAYYRETGDLPGFQARNRATRALWEDMIRDVFGQHYQETHALAQTALNSATETGGRVYAELSTGETVRIPSIPALYAVTDTVGAPAVPLIARITTAPRVEHTTTADLIRRA